MTTTTSWLSTFWRHPDLITGALGLSPGAGVADIGAGSGSFTFRFAGAIGASGAVFAVELDRLRLQGFLVFRPVVDGPR